MKIKGWDKINGFTYKGYCIVNPAYGVGSKGKYYADILDLNTPNKTKWELSLLTPDHKFVEGNEFILILWDNNKLHTRLALPKDMISDLSKFRHVFERLIDNMLHLRLQHDVKTFSSHSYQSAVTSAVQRINSGGNGTMGSGIVNHINNSGTTVQWQSIQSQAINTMQDLQKQIDKLNNNVKN